MSKGDEPYLCCESKSLDIKIERKDTNYWSIYTGGIALLRHMIYTYTYQQ